MNDSCENEESLPTYERKVHFESCDTDDEVEEEKKFEDVLYKEQQLQKIKNKV